MKRNDSSGPIAMNDVVLRDGFQSEARFVPTDVKVGLIDRLSVTGLRKLEITSFVSPRAVPNLRDAEEVARRVQRRPGVVLVALVPNEKGCERAVQCDLDEINLVLSISETHNLANMRMSTQESLAQFARVMHLVKGTRVQVNGTVATAFGCPFEGAQDPQRVLDMVGCYLDLGMDSVTLADTTGMANPRQVAELSRAFFERFPDVQLTMHFHNTRGMGLANLWAAVGAGVKSFDGSLGGLGGCPFAPGATGNICTEDAVHMLEEAGIATGVDLDELMAIARELPEIVGHDVPGQVVHAGRTSQLHPRPSIAAALEQCQ